MKINLICCLVVLGSLLILPVKAQSVLLQQDVNKDTVQSNWGPNRKHFFQSYCGLGFLLPIGSDIPKSQKFGFQTKFLQAGFRYKRRLNNTLATGLDLSYSRQTYSFRNKPGKFFPTSRMFEKEQLVANTLTLELYGRVNFGRRGDHLGTFIDIGGYGEWVFDNMLVTVEKPDSAGPAAPKRIKTKYKDLAYINPLQYGLSGRVGRGKLTLFARYRISDLLNSKVVYQLDPTHDPLFDPVFYIPQPDLPRFVMGLQISLG